MTMVTTTLFKYIQSELIKNGHSEIVKPDDSKYFDPPLDFTWFDDDVQFTTKILKYDEDVAEIVDHLFGGLSLMDKEHDLHFKKGFVNRFVNRQINRQTIESFQMVLVATFFSNEDYINRIYNDLDTYLTKKQTSDHKNKQVNKQENKGTTVTDNRSAFADLPQSTANLDVDSSIMNYATDNTISKNKQVNNQETDGETVGENSGVNRSYELDELFKTNGLLEQIYNTFDKKCFLQVW